MLTIRPRRAALRVVQLGSLPAVRPPLRRARRWAADNWPLLPALATVALLALPSGAMTALGGLTPADIASGALVAVAVIAVARGHRPALDRRGALVFGAAAVALGVVAVASAGQVAGVSGYIRQLQVFVLVPLALLVVVRGHRDFRLLAGAMLALAMVQGTVGIWQFTTAQGASYMGEDIRAVGTFGPLNVMGMATVVSFGLIIALAAALAPPDGAPRWWRPAALGCAGWLLVALAVSFSRGAWIALLLAAAAVILLSGCLSRRALALLLCGSLLLGAAACAVSPQLRDRLTSIGQAADSPDQSVIDRYAMWDAARAMWRDEPWTGVGLKGFAEHRDSHSSIALSSASDTAGAGMDFQRQSLESPHNMYLFLLSEQGLVGATALIGGWAVLLTGCLLRLRQTAAFGAVPRKADGVRSALRRMWPRRRGDRRNGGTSRTGGVMRRSTGGEPAPGRRENGLPVGRGAAGQGLVGQGGEQAQAHDRGGQVVPRRRAPGLDVGLVAAGLLIWQLVYFLSADIGGPTTVLTAVMLGLVAWWALAIPTPALADLPAPPAPTPAGRS